jgi:hypothetical protein
VSNFVIEKGVPLPGRGRSPIYPFEQMEVGDSFAVPEDKRHVVGPAAAWFGKRHGRKYSVRKTTGGFRVWRVE